jgi:putative spermidine/putrescine transport system permease protein
MKFDLDGTIAAASTVSILLALAVVLTIDRVVGLRATMKI